MPQPSSQPLLQRTRPLPEPELVSRPSTMLPPAAHARNHALPYSAIGWNYPRQQQRSVTPMTPSSPWHSSRILYVSPPPTQPTPSFPQPDPTQTPTQNFSPQLHPYTHSRLTFPSPPAVIHSQPVFSVASPPLITSHLTYPNPPNS